MPTGCARWAQLPSRSRPSKSHRLLPSPRSMPRSHRSPVSTWLPSPAPTRSPPSSERARLLGIAFRSPRRIAVVGPSTARAVEAIGLQADVIPPTFTAESLAETLRPEAPGKRFLLVLAEAAPTTLRDGLESAGGQVTVAAAYSNRIPAASLQAITSLFSNPGNCPDAVTFTSASTAANLVALLEACWPHPAGRRCSRLHRPHYLARAARPWSAAARSKLRNPPSPHWSPPWNCTSNQPSNKSCIAAAGRAWVLLIQLGGCTVFL